MIKKYWSIDLSRFAYIISGSQSSFSANLWIIYPPGHFSIGNRFASHKHLTKYLNIEDLPLHLIYYSFILCFSYFSLPFFHSLLNCLNCYTVELLRCLQSQTLKWSCKKLSSKHLLSYTILFYVSLSFSLKNTLLLLPSSSFLLPPSSDPLAFPHRLTFGAPQVEWKARTGPCYPFKNKLANED